MSEVGQELRNLLHEIEDDADALHQTALAEKVFLAQKLLAVLGH